MSALVVIVTARPNPDCGGDSGCGGSSTGNSIHEQSSSSTNTVYESSLSSGGNSAHGTVGLERVGGGQISAGFTAGSGQPSSTIYESSVTSGGNSAHGTIGAGQHSAGLTVKTSQYSSGSQGNSGQTSAGFSRGSGAGSSGETITNVVVSSQPAVSVRGGFGGNGGSINVAQAGGSNVRQTASSQYSSGSGSVGGGSQSFSAQQYSSYNDGQSVAEQQDLTPIITKQFYVYAAPEEEDVNQAPRYVPIGRPQKNYNIIFIKTPQYGLNSQVIPVVQPNEEKTIVYVLSKKPSFNQDIQLPPVPVTEPAKPDVFFIKYKNDKEALEAQQKIQGNY